MLLKRLEEFDKHVVRNNIIHNDLIGHMLVYVIYLSWQSGDKDFVHVLGHRTVKASAEVTALDIQEQSQWQRDT